MIDEKKIKEAATNHMIKEYCDDGDWSFPCDTDDIKEQCELDFKAGAAWAQREFVKSLWHDASEEAKDHTDIVYIDEKGNVWSEFDYYADNYDDAFHKGWLSFVNNGVLRVIKWCYLSDILPKEGGEK